ncbi:MAG: hypothetical protein PHS54_00160 [Clostridia bacterium]|nr:hypothetical protein [Clostridia bacterium]
MADNLIYCASSTIVTGVTSTLDYLVVNINNKNVGLPLYQFSYSTPSLDFADLLKLDFSVSNATLMQNGTSYGAGVATYVNNSAFAFPLFKIDNGNPQYVVKVDTPTIVSQLTSHGLYVAVEVNNKAYGIPLFEYSTEFPFVTTVPMSSIKINTKFVKPVQNISPANRPSTNLNNKIKTYENLINRVKYQLGHPFVTLEVCEDTQMVDYIDKALEWYTKYAGYTEEFLVFSSQLYREPGLQIDTLFSITPTLREAYATGAIPSWDYDLGSYRKVIGIFSFQQGESTGINSLFTLEQAMAQQTYFSYMLGNAGFDLVTWECLKGWLELREKVLAQIPYVDFNNRTQTMRIIPAPNSNSAYYGVVGCWVEKPIADLIMERWVEAYVLALTKISIGNIRGKYQAMQLFGGGTINYNDLLSQGLKEKEELEKELMNGYGEVTPARFFLG